MFTTMIHPGEELEAELRGAIIAPGDDHYDAARKAWNLTVEQHPALIVRATCAEDVAAAVRYARHAGLPVAVQATGHGMRRPANDALLINTAQMDGVVVDAVNHTN